MAERKFNTPREADLGLAEATNAAGLSLSVLPNGSLFSISHSDDKGTTQINQVLGQPAHGGIGRLYLRIGGAAPRIVELLGPEARVSLAASGRLVAFEGADGAVRYRVGIELAEDAPLWLWRVEIETAEPLPCDLVLLQDVGLGGRGFVMGSEAYVSQYIDHAIVDHPRFGPVILSRQAQAQNGRFPWLAFGALDGAVSYATDAMQTLGPAYRIGGRFDLGFGTSLPGTRLQHEVACPTLQSRPLAPAPGKPATATFFALFQPDHPAASGSDDLALLAAVTAAAQRPAPDWPACRPAVRAIPQDAPLVVADRLDDAALAALYPSRLLEEHDAAGLLSFFVADGAQNRHVVLRDKEGEVRRRTGAMLRSGTGMTLDETTLCATHWMHGVFAAQLTIGNTSFHKLFSVSRDPYGITRASGLRILVDLGEGWRFLAVPSAFDIGLGECRWVYRIDRRTITVEAVVGGEASAMTWRVSVEGAACRFLVLGHVVLGEREFESVGRIAIDPDRGRITLRFDPDSLWGRTYPDAAYQIVCDTPDGLDAIGGDELLYEDGIARGGPYVALRSTPTNSLSFSVVGSMVSAAEADALAVRYAADPGLDASRDASRRYWDGVTRKARIEGGGQEETAAQSAMLPWLAHDAMIHLTVPHGLEQYTGAAWGTRDVCQGPIEFLLSMEHDDTVRDILLTLFSEQWEERGDWPQWFMLEPYPQIRPGSAHGDVIVWPLKALCDYIEETGDHAILDAEVAWRRDADHKRSAGAATIAAHVEKLLATVEARFIPGTHLIRYGEGDWNDSLQPVDHSWPDWMVSSWTVALLYEQLRRYAVIARTHGRASTADALSLLADAMREDFHRHLMADGLVAGYGLFNPDGGDCELLLHPSDRRTGIAYSLIPMTQAILGGLFDDGEAKAHLDIIRRHLLFPDGVRLMDKPIAYAGGTERLFRRAESAAYFGREIGLMYTHAHLRYCEALTRLSAAEEAWDALGLVNPVAINGLLPQADRRQRNTYFSSSDAAFPDRYCASAEWHRVAEGSITVDGGWRIYSSGPGLYTNVLVRHVFGRRRWHGERRDTPVLPEGLKTARLVLE